MAKDIRLAGDAKGMMKLISERTGIDYDTAAYKPEDEGRPAQKSQQISNKEL